MPALGTVEVEAYSRVELVAASDHQQRLRLRQGALDVSIYAPPGKFYVETPAGTAIDPRLRLFGQRGRQRQRPAGRCARGWVGFRLGSARIAAAGGGGVQPARRPRVRARPGWPTPRSYFRRAVTVLDGPSSQEEQAFALGTVLSQARPQDAFTLWHLLDRLPPESRPMVLRRLVQLVPAAAVVPRKRVLAGEQAARDAAVGPAGDGSHCPLAPLVGRSALTNGLTNRRYEP